MSESKFIYELTAIASLASNDKFPVYDASGTVTGYVEASVIKTFVAQTAAEILTAIKTVDGSASGLDADLLDGNEATAFEAARTLMSQVIAEAGSDTTVYSVNALRLRQAATAAIAAWVGAAPSALDTLDELAAALGDDANYAATITTALSGKQPIDATLTALAALTTAANKLIYATGSDTFATADLTAFGRSLMALADLPAAKAALGIDSIDLTSEVDGILPVANGGTGQSALSGVDAADLGSGAASSGLVLKSNGAGGTSWEGESGGGGSDPSVAYVRSDGNNGTAAVGSPALAYLTMQAAYDAGARVFDLGVGTFAGISAAGAVNITIRGRGRTKTTVTLIASTNAGAVTVYDQGRQSATIAEITSIGAAGAVDTNGGNAGAVSVEGCYVTLINNYGGAGGAESASSPGAGGNGGSVAVSATGFVGTANNYGGGGGAGTTTDGGAGGSAGDVMILDSRADAVQCYGAAGGNSSATNGGNGGNGAAVTVINSVVTTEVNMDAGSVGSGGTATAGACGQFTGENCSVAQVSMTDGSAAGTIAGAMVYIPSIGNGTPAVTAVISHVNGSPY